MVSKRWCKESKLEIPVNFHDQLPMFNRSVRNRSHAGENGRRCQFFPGLSYTGPDSANGRASASGAEGRGFDPGPRHTKGVKMVPVATLLGAQHYKASTGSSLTHY